MSNDTHRLLRYMYDELAPDEASELEHELRHRPDLFDQWFAFHEAKQPLDAQPTPRPDAAVVDAIVAQAADAARPAEAQPIDTRPVDTRPVDTQPASAPERGDGVPQRIAAGGPVPTSGAARQQASRMPRQQAVQAAPWGLALALAMVLLLSGVPGGGGTGHAAHASSDLPAWDAAGERVALHRQAAAIESRMPPPDLSASPALSSVSR